MTLSATLEPTTGSRARKVDVSRGECRTDLAIECFSRPDDERYLTLDDLIEACTRRYDASRESTVDLHSLIVDADPEKGLVLAGHDGLPTRFNNWSYIQACRTVGAPHQYISTLPPSLAATCLQSSLARCKDAEAGLYIDVRTNQLRALTSARYGRIPDFEVVERFKSMAEFGTARWKVPGCMDWSTMTYNPNVPVTLASTTLFASDRDVCFFLCTDLDPIEVGKLDDGSPDLMFRGILVRNSEVGAFKLTVSMMLLRGVCQNRCLWGVENFREISLIHSEYAPDKFQDLVMPQLDTIARADKQTVVDGVALAKEPMRALQGNDEQSRRDAQLEFLITRLKFTKKTATAILDHYAPGTGEVASAWDLANKITSYAQTRDYQEERIAMERAAGRLLDKVTR